MTDIILIDLAFFSLFIQTSVIEYLFQINRELRKELGNPHLSRLKNLTHCEIEILINYYF